MEYQSETFDYKAAAVNRDPNIPRSKFIIKKAIKIYPDTLCWIRDFAYAYNEPMAKQYFSHPAFGNYPVVGISWKQATAFCEWRTLYLNSFLESKNKATESDFRLPTEAQWEYAATRLPGLAWGDVWEWTASDFEPYPGFAAHPYRDYSRPWFGSRKVLRGACAATLPVMRNPRYRNYFTPERSDIYAGFRTCAL